MTPHVESWLHQSNPDSHIHTPKHRLTVSLNDPLFDDFGFSSSILRGKQQAALPRPGTCRFIAWLVSMTANLLLNWSSGEECRFLIFSFCSAFFSYIGGVRMLLASAGVWSRLICCSLGPGDRRASPWRNTIFLQMKSIDCPSLFCPLYRFLPGFQTHYSKRFLPPIFCLVLDREQYVGNMPKLTDTGPSRTSCGLVPWSSYMPSSLITNANKGIQSFPINRSGRTIYSTGLFHEISYEECLRCSSCQWSSA